MNERKSTGEADKGQPNDSHLFNEPAYVLSAAAVDTRQEKDVSYADGKKTKARVGVKFYDLADPLLK